MLPGFWDSGCHACIIIDLVNTALVNRSSEKTKRMIAEVYRTHSVVTGPMNFKKLGHFFFPENHASGILGHLAAIQAL